MSISAPEHIRFCARCAGTMRTKERAGKPRRVCEDCEHIHFIEAKVAVGALVLEDGRVLLVKRAKPPEKGKWCLPGGYLDYAENPKRATARELLEETHLEISVGEIFDVYFNPLTDSSQPGASLLVLYRAEAIGGSLQADDDAAEARYFALDALPELAFDSTVKAINQLRALQSSESPRKQHADL